MPHSVSIDHPIGCRGCLFQAHRREVQKLVDDSRRHRLDRTPLALVQPAEHTLRFRELLFADLLRAGAQRRDRRNDVERRLPLMELLRFSGHDRLCPLRLAAAAGERLGHDRLQIVDVVEIAPVQIVDGRVEIARDCEVDEQQLPTAAHTLDGLGVENEAGRGRRRDHHVGAGELLLELRAVGLAVGDERDARAAGAKVPRGLLADLAGADEQNVAAVELAEYLLREGRSRRGDGRRTFTDGGLRPHLASGVQGVPEHAVEQRPCRACVVGRAHLSENLALTRNERVEPGSDAEQMQRGSVVAQAVQRRLELRQDLDRPALGLVGVFGFDVQLGAVARREAYRPPEALGQRMRLLGVERDALAQLDRSVMVPGSDENEAHHPKWVAGRASRTTITSAKPASAMYAARRPAQPAARAPRYPVQTTHVTSVAMTRASIRSPRLTSRAMPTPIPRVSAGTDTRTVRPASRSSTASEGAGRSSRVASAGAPARDRGRTARRRG